MVNQQRGGTLVGFIMGLVVGMTVALGVAVYVTKVPIPFMNKGMTRSAEQDAAEEKKNKDWDPNAPLYGKNAAKPSDKTDTAPDAPKAEAKPEVKPDLKPVDPKPDVAGKVDPKSADPLGDLAKAKADLKVAEPKPALMPASSPAAVDPFIYFVQAGAYRTPEEADAQRAKMGLLGLDAKVSERDQGGRTVYRVRVGPSDKIEAERVRAKLEAAHLDSAMVRVQR
jgi:cell division protein FtsN